MSMGDREERVLVLAPVGRDGLLAARAIEADGAPATVCPDMAAFCAEMRSGAAAGVLTEEALAAGPRAMLKAALEGQPLWSDFPLVICAVRPATAAERSAMATVASNFGNITLLDRPIHPETLIGSVRSALRARRRQYQARELLARLENAVRQREQFLATLSHELRNPLGAIRNAVQLLSTALPADSQLHRPTSVIDRQSRHLGRLVDDLLDVSRVTTGKVILQRQTVDLRAIVEGVIQQLTPAFAQHGLSPTHDLGPAACPVNGDPMRLEQIFNNLVTNAIKYTPSGGQVEVTLRLSGSKVAVKISDTGVGMTPETLSQVFELFSQADRSLDRAQGGMGIGLTLVRALTELHGGTVVATSDGLGRGSAVEVTLPVAEPVVVAPVADVPRGNAVSGRRILIVEDSPDNRETLQALLELEGHLVEVAGDGVEALEAVARSRPEVALIDIGLPGIDGYELARQMRAGPGKDILLVALTGYGCPEDRQRSAEAGFDRHLTKPPDLRELSAVLAGR